MKKTAYVSNFLESLQAYEPKYLVIEIENKEE
jgi:hypothetical protein